MSVKTQVLRAAAAAVAATALLLPAACGTTNDTATDANVDSSDITQQTVTPGTLTIATGDPAYTPWVLNDDPESGEGYEAAVAYAVAEQLGFSEDDVQWVRTTFDAAIAPGAKDWDLNIQQFSITDERKQAVDFSPSYYNPTQAVVVRQDSPYASATSIDELKDATIGAMVGTTSYDFAKELIKDDIQTFNDNAMLAQALAANQIDALVVDSPTAVNIVESGQVENGVVLGQIPDSEDPQGMGIVLPKDSVLTDAVTDAVNALIEDGTLAALQEQWLAEYTTDIPTLE
ncbi:ABC transporter substrate-binding protein [Bifidobacterium lemurum]|uniref:ABC transporter substrate-binding protein n=1 Tax=Bifidobacterium lemurum TaxID=1603886 RepID=A0A261FS63_9BIFI|nr:ABC transporter substrate-binding protein [Bifidobacterium lemurum]OZG61918.1 ABC transporter substrate-binding protein [Bifidobacterium lemurum]QOL33290.1 amino acid ABC transporter substrate-binding protein [Bifidobacterium lemurum]